MSGKTLFNLVPALGLALILGLLLTGLPGAAGAQGVQPQDALGGAFTYQGRLVKDGNAVTDTCAFQFSLWDAGNGGNRIGNTQTAGGVSVNDGYLTVLLNDADEFGSGAFAGNERYLQIAAKCSGDSTFVPLSGRAALSAAPYALYARSAPWSGLAGVPAGFADGVDNGGDYQNVIVVAKSGGDFTSIQAALNGITGNSAAQRYLVWVAPGTYTGTVTMKPYVDIQGAGELATRITAGGGDSANTGTVVGTDNAELRFLTVENSGGNTVGIGIYNHSASPRLIHVTVVVSGAIESGQIYGVYNDASSPVMTDVTITVNAPGEYETTAYGVSNTNHSSPPLTNVAVTVAAYVTEAFGTVAYGVYNGSDSAPVMTGVAVEAVGGSGYGVYNDASSPAMTGLIIEAQGIFAYGVYNYFSSPTMADVVATVKGTEVHGAYNDFSSPTMTGMIITASGLIGYGTYNASSSPILTNVTITAGREDGEGYGIYNTATGGSYTVRVNNSRITCFNGNTIVNDAEFTTRVGTSQLAGGAVVTGGGTVTCAGVYDENYAFRASTCP